MSTDGPMADKRPTRRNAARGTQDLPSEQLQSSPIRSQDEHDQLSFGEPSRPRMQVKVTYAGKKSKSQSPLKASPSHRPDSKSTPKRPIPTTPLRVQSRARATPSSRGRKGTKQKSPIKVEVIPLDDSVSDTPSWRSPKSTTNGFTRSALAAAMSVPRGKKRRLSPPSTDYSGESEEESDLTPLSSEAEDSSGSGVDESAPLPSTSRKHDPVTRQGKDDEYLGKDGDLVWVHLDASGAPSESKEGVWWPAKVTSLRPLKVAPFGQPPGNSSQSVQEMIVPVPSPNVILSIRTRTRKMRFDDKSFTHIAAFEDLAKSPRKKTRTDHSTVIERWKEARDLMLQAYEDEHDGLPLLLSHYKGSSLYKSQDVSGAVDSNSESGSEGDVESLWIDPGPDPLFELPGELVLAKEKPKYNQYWPAKVLRYIERKQPNDKEKYEVLYFDGIQKIIPRDMILSSFDDGFRRCRMGDSADNYGLDEDAESNGAAGTSPFSEEEPDEDSLRQTSPAPVPPQNAADFLKFSISEQFEYAKPVLISLLNGRYSPAKELHVRFMKGGKPREQVASTAWQRGEISHGDKEELAVCIRRWMKRRGRRQALGLVAEDVQVEIFGEPIILENEDHKDRTITNEDTSHETHTIPLLASQVSAGDTERARSSDVEEPPLSFVTSSVVEDDSMSIDGHKVSTGSGPESRANNVSAAQQEKNGPLPEHTDVEDPHRSSVTSRTLPTYAMLSDIDQITYCMSVLLPEAILQLLLWRNGLRKTADLLSEEEENMLHREGESLMSAAYWVHEIIRLKRSAERKTLPQYKSNPEVEYSLSGRIKRKSLRD